MVNMEDPEAVKWYKAKLDTLKALGLDSFKFDGGESCYMPSGIRTRIAIVIHPSGIWGLFYIRS